MDLNCVKESILAGRNLPHIYVLGIKDGSRTLLCSRLNSWEVQQTSGAASTQVCIPHTGDEILGQDHSARMAAFVPGKVLHEKRKTALV